MLRALMLCLGLFLLPQYVQAGPLEDCNQYKDADRTIRGCTQALERMSFDRSNRAKVYRNRGHGYSLKGDDEKALADYSQAIALDPNSGHVRRGQIYIRKGDADRALTDFNTAIKLDKADPEPLQERGAIYESRGLTDLAK